MCARASLRPAVGAAREARGVTAVWRAFPRMGECEGATRASAGKCVSGVGVACANSRRPGGGSQARAE